MKLTQILLASTLATVAATSFAAPNAQSSPIQEEQKVVVSTQEQPTAAEDATTNSSAAQPASEANAESTAPAQPAQ